MTPNPFFKKIVESVHADGGKFTFDTECQVAGCNRASEWIDRFDELVGSEIGDMLEVELCRNHHLVFLKPRKEHIAIEVKA